MTSVRNRVKGVTRAAKTRWPNVVALRALELLATTVAAIGGFFIASAPQMGGWCLWIGAIFALIYLCWQLAGYYFFLSPRTLRNYWAARVGGVGLLLSGALTNTHDGSSAIGIVLIFLAVVLAALIDGPWFQDIAPLETANIPPPSQDYPSQFAHRTVGRLVVVLIAVLLTGSLALLHVASSFILVMGLACLTLMVWEFVRVCRWVYAARYWPIRYLQKLQPNFMMPYGGKAVFHIPMWEPYLRQLKRPFFIATVHAETVEAIAKTTDVPVIALGTPTIREVNSIVPRSVRAAFYVHNAGSNKCFLADKSVRSVWLHHGDSDKHACYRGKSAEYDRLFVAGRAAIDRYHDNGVLISEEKFVIIGRPQATSIRVVETHIEECSTPVVLYAPTWQGKGANRTYSSLIPMGQDIIRALIAHGATIIFRPHPVSHRDGHTAEKRQIVSIWELLETDARDSGRQHIWGTRAETTWSVADVTNHSDAMISDVSGIVVDYMQSGKPFAMVSPELSAQQFRTAYPTAQSAYVIEKQSGSLGQTLRDMLYDDSMQTVRSNRRAYYLGGFSGNGSLCAFLEAATEAVNHTGL